MWSQTLLSLIVIFLTELPPASWKRFFVFASGNTRGAHRDFVQKFTSCGQTEVDTDEDCDYFLVFCPVVSRVGTDVSEALSKAPAGKPIILVVMHHTFNHEYVVADSRRLVTDNCNVTLAVDCLFYENHFLDCQRNDAAWAKVKQHLDVTSPAPDCHISRRLKKMLLICGVIVILGIIIALIIVFKYEGVCLDDFMMNRGLSAQERPVTGVSASTEKVRNHFMTEAGKRRRKDDKVGSSSNWDHFG